LEEMSMVLVEPRKRLNILSKSTLFRRHSFSGSASSSLNLETLEPAVDFPVQFNFGSLYSSSLTIFFDFEDEQTGAGKSREKTTVHRRSLVQ